MSTIELLTSVTSVRNGRRKMEDKHVVIHDLNSACKLNILKKYSFYGVYDGHGGVDAANFCANNLHQILVKTRSFNEGNIEKALKETFNETDRLFCNSLLKTQSGCTALVCLREIDEGEDGHLKTKLYFAWVGDSQAILVRDGVAIDITPPHKPDDDMEIQRIETSGGRVVKTDCHRVQGILAVSRAIGDANYKPYVTSDPGIAVEVLNGNEDFLILACDGLWDQIDCDSATQLVYESIQESKYPRDAAKNISQALVQFAKDEGSSDNITVVVVFLRRLEDILPMTDFSCESPNIELNTTQEVDKSVLMVGTEPVRLRVKSSANKDDLGMLIAGESILNFKNGSVTSTPPQQLIELPSPTSNCLVDVNNENVENVPQENQSQVVPPLIKSASSSENDADSESRCTTSSSPPPALPQSSYTHDLLQFTPSNSTCNLDTSETALPEKEKSSEQVIKTEIIVKSPPQNMFSSTNSSPYFKNESFKMEEEFEETIITTETISDPIPMSHVSESSIKTEEVTDLFGDVDLNHRPPSPSKMFEKSPFDFSTFSSVIKQEQKKESEVVEIPVTVIESKESSRQTVRFETDTISPATERRTLLKSPLPPKKSPSPHDMSTESQVSLNTSSKSLTNGLAGKVVSKVAEKSLSTKNVNTTKVNLITGKTSSRVALTSKPSATRTVTTARSSSLLSKPITATRTAGAPKSSNLASRVSSKPTEISSSGTTAVTTAARKPISALTKPLVRPTTSTTSRLTTKSTVTTAKTVADGVKARVPITSSRVAAPRPTASTAGSVTRPTSRPPAKVSVPNGLAAKPSSTSRITARQPTTATSTKTGAPLVPRVAAVTSRLAASKKPAVSGTSSDSTKAVKKPIAAPSVGLGVKSSTSTKVSPVAGAKRTLAFGRMV